MPSFKKNFLKIFTGSVSGQIIAILLLPILSRIITPDALGQYSISIILIMILSPLCCLKLDQALLTSNKEDKQNIFFSAIYISSIISLIIFFISIVAFYIFNFLYFEWYIYTTLSLYTFTVSQLTVSYSLSTGNFSTAVKHRFVRTTLCLFLQIGISYISSISNSLLIAYIISNLISIIFFKNIHITSLTSYFSPRKISFIIKENKNFTYYQTISELFSMSSQYIVNLSMAVFSTSAVIGMYSMTTRTMQAPITLITSSVKEAFYYKIKKIKDKKNIRKELIKISAFLLIPSLIISITTFKHLPFLFGFIFGNQWTESGVYAQILLPWFILLFINQPYSAAANIIGIQKKILFIDIFSFLIRSASIIISWVMFDSIYTTLLVFSFTGILLNLWLIILVYKNCTKD
ncbi:lipopolysaccharide biosynthesis protein [Xenorhabdus anantnagensis]|uniref:Oligosaccharide flippase family protein n=1 Tax=Xenorhabdus anantnagensis TaxID=3025875 RepID=A0ABT5LUQ4_9GAMM|nr:oligosaccharide flippase family protein [Xenorhabdus anantnagensis]MDC9596809.1 oligosaccharide flippase family protein [Xenorhabdus anantnagensis]